MNNLIESKPLSINDLDKATLEKFYYKESKTQLEIAKIFNCKQHQISRLMQNFNLPVITGRGKIINLVGKRFGKLVVIEPVFGSLSKKQFRWRCKCDCGGIIDVRRVPLVFGKVNACSCTKKDFPSGRNNHAWRGYNNIPGGFMSKYKSHAKRRNIFFDLSIQYLDELFVKQKGLCALTGVELSFENYGYITFHSNVSLDRIDSSKGYIEGNVQWVHKNINFMKQSFSVEEFIIWCKKVVIFNEGK